MIIHNVGYHHQHDSDFKIERPTGTGDLLFLLVKTDAIFSLDGQDFLVPKNFVWIYPIGEPQYYRAVPKELFENDWIHFLWEKEEEQTFQKHRIPYCTPIPLENVEFYSYCIKMIAEEFSSRHFYAQDTIQHYFQIMLNKLAEHLYEQHAFGNQSRYEMMLTIRNKIYSHPEELRDIHWVSHETSMSRSSFHHLYKKYFGVSFIQDLLNSRITYAKMLLSTTNLSVHDIAGKCGFHNYEHFARIFKRECGVSALQYRKQKTAGS